jgi:DNA-directed RNA polymerase specialized sigma24 family protein
LACLDPDRDAAGAKYVEVRGHLVRFFEWRGCPYPEDHADEAITRTAARIGGGEEVREPAKYVVGVARLLLLEIHRDREKQRRMTAEIGPPQTSPDTSAGLEQRIECLRHCLDRLSPEDRDLILQYYEGDKAVKISNRRRLTERLQLNLNTLRTRALRLRQRLQSCVETCLETSRDGL